MATPRPRRSATPSKSVPLERGNADTPSTGQSVVLLPTDATQSPAGPVASALRAGQASSLVLSDERPIRGLSVTTNSGFPSLQRAAGDPRVRTETGLAVGALIVRNPSKTLLLLTRMLDRIHKRAKALHAAAEAK